MERSELNTVLTQWLHNEMDELQVWQWAGEQLEQGFAPADELVKDIVELLAALPYEMVLREDLAVFLDALANPAAETDLSINLLWNHMDTVNVDSRRLQHADHPFYGQFANAD